MGNNTGGYDYEKRVVEALVHSGYSGEIAEPAGASSVGADADMMIQGKRYLVEIKQDAKAQMGGTSLSYDEEGFGFIGSSVASDTASAVLTEMNCRQSAVQRLLESVGAESFPLACDKQTWNKAKEEGLLKPVNAVVKRNTDFICDHYTNKGVHYIQIGDSGLFHLGENPANLPVPKLEGEINLEVRAGRSGSRKRKDGTEVVSGGLRVQGRLQFNGKSDFTLDDISSIEKMMKEVG